MTITRGTYTGSTPITLTATGLPAGVTFTDNGNGSYVLAGTWPAVAGTYPYTVVATNAFGSVTVPNNQLISTVAVVAPMAPALPDTMGVAGAAINYLSPAWTGTSPIVLTATGVPAGVIFTDNGNGRFTLSGVRQPVGTASVTVTGTNSGGSAGDTFNVISTAAGVAPVAPVLSDTSGTTGTAITYMSPAWTGTSPIVLTATGIPAGVTFTDNGNGTFSLSGVYPAVGVSSVTVTGTNGSGSAGDTFTVTAVALTAGFNGAAITSVDDDRTAGISLFGPGNTARAGVFIGSLVGLYPTLPQINAITCGMANEGTDSSVSGGVNTEVDPNSSTTSIKSTALNSQSLVTEIRLTFISGSRTNLTTGAVTPLTAPDFINSTGGAYVSGTFIPFNGTQRLNMAMQQDASNAGPVPGTSRSMIVECSFKYSNGTITSQNVTCTATAADTTTPP